MKRILILTGIILLALFVLMARTKADESTEIFVIELAPTPEPTPDPNAPTPPPQTPEPVFVLVDYSNDPQDIDIAARSAYYSPFDKLYWKFVLWSVEMNRTTCGRMDNGIPLYSKTFVEVATNTNEFPFWSARLPKSTRGQEILRLNRIAADLFFDYYESTVACGTEPIVPYDGVILEFVQNDAGLNRSANVYNLDGKCLTLMDEDEFNATIGAEYLKRLNGE